MQLESISISNFRLFEKLNFDFPKGNGLFLLTGDNKKDPSLGSNGCGKSTFLDAICWCLYEKSSDLLSAGDLLNENKKGGYSVTLKFDSMEISRSWKPNSIYIDKKAATNEEVIDKIGLNFDQFLYSVFFHQGAAHFLDLTPGKKLDFLSEIFDLDLWSEYANDAKDVAEETRAKVTPLGVKLAMLNNSISNINNQSSSLLAQSDKWAEEQKASRTAIGDKLKELKKQHQQWNTIQNNKIQEMVTQANVLRDQRKAIDPSKDEVDKLDQGLKELIELKEQLEQVIKSQDEISNKARNDYFIKASVRSSEMSKLTSLSNKLLELETKANKNCPSCEQLITEDHVEKCKRSLSVEIAGQQVIVDRVVKEFEFEITPVFNESVKELEELKESAKELDKEERDLLSKKVEKSNLSSQINSLEKQITNLTNEKSPYPEQIEYFEMKILAEDGENPYEDQVAQNIEIIKKHKQEISDITNEIKELDKKTSEMEFWKKEFSKIRLFELDDVAQSLEIYLNQAVNNLGLNDWYISVSTEKTLADERVKKELNVKVFVSGKEIKISTRSGSEKQRLRIASAIGISDLIKSRCGVDWPFLILDEPTVSLSTVGVDFMIDYLESVSQYCQILLSENRILDMGNFDDVFLIVRDQKISIFKQSQTPILVNAH